MPTHQDETLQQRYARENHDYLKLCGSMTAEQVADLKLQLNNSLAREQALQQRLTVAEKLLQRVHQADALSHCCPLWKAIDAALKPAAKPHKCIECESQYCHGVCVERGDDDERYKGAEGEGS